MEGVRGGERGVEGVRDGERGVEGVEGVRVGRS